MRRTFLTLSVLLTLLLLSLGIVLNLRCVGVEPLAPPDPATPIWLADGTEVPLADALARLRDRSLQVDATALLEAPREAPPAGDATEPDGAAPGTSAPPPDPRNDATVRALIEAELAKQGPVFLLAEQRRHEGDLDQALALYLSIPEDDPSWARAQRRIGWDILTEGKGQPERGLQYLHRALQEESMDGNSWQDIARGYASTLGLDLD